MVDGSQWEVHRRSRLHRARATRAAKLRKKKGTRKAVKHHATAEKDNSDEVGVMVAVDEDKSDEVASMVAEDQEHSMV